MGIPKYIIDSARKYRDEHGGSELLFDAFIAGYEATRKPKSNQVVLTDEQQSYFEKCWEAYKRKGDKALAKKFWADIPHSSFHAIYDHIRAYVSNREVRFQKDFERYLRDCEYKKIVFNGNSIAFDPTNFDDKTEYHPILDGIFTTWDDEEKCVRLSNNNIEGFCDGYSEENRPDGATVKYGMYTWKWSSGKVKWVRQ